MRKSALVSAFVMSLVGYTANAATCGSYSHNLTNGQSADASQVMDNFRDIQNCANTQLAPLANPGFTGNVTMAGPAPSLIITDTAGSGVARIVVTDSGNNSYSIGRSSSSGYLVFNSYQATYSGYQLITSGGGGITVNASGYVGVNTAPSYALTVNGTAYASGAAGALSDVRDKDGIKQLPDDALGIVAKLKPVSFQWKDPKDDGMRGEQLGFIAQDVAKVLPSMVLIGKDERQSEALKYNEFIPILAKAIQEQQAQIVELRAELAAIKSAAPSSR